MTGATLRGCCTAGIFLLSLQQVSEVLGGQTEGCYSSFGWRLFSSCERFSLIDVNKPPFVIPFQMGFEEMAQMQRTSCRNWSWFCTGNEGLQVKVILPANAVQQKWNASPTCDFKFPSSHMKINTNRCSLF